MLTKLLTINHWLFVFTASWDEADTQMPVESHSDSKNHGELDPVRFTFEYLMP